MARQRKKKGTPDAPPPTQPTAVLVRRLSRELEVYELGQTNTYPAGTDVATLVPETRAWLERNPGWLQLDTPVKAKADPALVAAQADIAKANGQLDLATVAFVAAGTAKETKAAKKAGDLAREALSVAEARLAALTDAGE